MGNTTSSAGQAQSWFMDDILGINPDPVYSQSAPADGGAPAQAPPPAQPQMAQAEVPQPMTPDQPGPSPAIQNIINTAPATPPQPPAFGSAPGRTASRPKGAPSTFLGQSALPARRQAAGGFGFDKQSSGSKTLIGS